MSDGIDKINSVFIDKALFTNKNEEYGSQLNQEDAFEFAQMLEDETLQVGSLGDQILKQFTQITQHMQKSKNDANISIKQAASNPDPKNIIQMMHKINDYSEQVTIGSRIVTKIATATDQLTKLQ